MGSQFSSDRYINLFDHLEEAWTERVIGGNPVYLIDPAEGFEDSVIKSLDQPSRVYSPGNRRTFLPDCIMDPVPAFPGLLLLLTASGALEQSPTDPAMSDGSPRLRQCLYQMHSIFYAEGPAFRQDYVTPSFSNVEVYGIIAHILDLEPATTDGNLDNVRTSSLVSFRSIKRPPRWRGGLYWLVQLLLGGPLQPLQNGEDKCCRQQACDHEDRPQLPQLDLFPEETSDKEQFVTLRPWPATSLPASPLEPVGATLETNESPMGLRNSSANVRIR